METDQLAVSTTFGFEQAGGSGDVRLTRPFWTESAGSIFKDVARGGLLADQKVPNLVVGLVQLRHSGEKSALKGVMNEGLEEGGELAAK